MSGLAKYLLQKGYDVSGSDITEMVNTATKELIADGTLETLAKKYELDAVLIK